MAVEKQMWDALFRQLSLETAQIFSAFYRIVIEQNKKISDLERELKKGGVNRSQSSITKILNSLNQVFEEQSKKGKLFNKKGNNYTSTKYGDILYNFCFKLKSDISLLSGELAEASGYSKLSIAFSTFGLPYVYAIKKNVETRGNPNLRTIYVNMRTKDIPNILSKTNTIDYALGESLRTERLNHDDNVNRLLLHSDRIESALVGTEEIYIVSNFPLEKNSYSKDECRLFDVATVDQGIMIKFLADLYDINTIYGKLDREATEDLIKKGVRLLTPLYDNVHTLIESFVIEANHKVVIFSGETVAEQISQRHDYVRSKLNNTDIDMPTIIEKAHMDKPNYLDKRLYRRIRDIERFPSNHPYNAFWKEAKRIEKRLL